MNRMQTVDVLRTQGIMARGYGIIPQLIARDERLTPEAKSIYCYFSSFAGAGFEPVFPSRDLMLKELNMSKDRYYRHLKLLITCNYISVERVKVGNLHSKNIYTLVQLPNAKEPVIEGTEAIHVKRPSSIKKRLGQKIKAAVSASTIVLKPDMEQVDNIPEKLISHPEKKDGSAGNLLRAQLGIDALIEKRPEHKELIQSIFMVIEDMWTSEQVTMGGSVKKKNAIRKLLGGLRLVHIESLVNNITCSGQKIRNKKAYIQSCLSNIFVDMAGPLDYSKAPNKPDSKSQEDIEKEKQRLEYQRNPELMELDQQISEIGIKISKSILSGDELRTAALRKETELLEEKREALVVRINAISG